MTRDDHVESAHEEVEDKRTWSHVGQSYVVDRWRNNVGTTTKVNETECNIACFFKGEKKKAKRGGTDTDEEDSDEEEERLVCSMTGRR